MYESTDFNFMLIWDNKLAENKITKAEIPIDINYTLKNKVRLSSLTPRGFIIDKSNKIVFTSDANLEILADKIWELQGRPDYRYKAFNQIVNDFSKRDSNIQSSNKSTIIMFSADRCESCSNDKKKIIQTPKLNNTFDIIFIEGSNTTDESLYNEKSFNFYSGSSTHDYSNNECICSRLR